MRSGHFTLRSWLEVRSVKDRALPLAYTGQNVPLCPLQLLATAVRASQPPPVPCLSTQLLA